MNRFLALFLFPFVVQAEPAPLSHLEKEGRLEIATPLYTATFDQKEGYRLIALKDQQSGKSTSFTKSGLRVTEEGEYREFMNRWFGNPKVHEQYDAAVVATVEKVSGEELTLTLQWEHPVGKIKQVYRFAAGTRQIHSEVNFTITAPVVEFSYLLESPQFGSSDGETTTLYPDETLWSGSSIFGFHHRIPEGKFLYNQRQQNGFGLGATATSGAASIETFLRGKQEGFPSRLGRLSIHSTTTRWNPLPSEVSLRFTLLAGGTPDESFLFSQAMTGEDPPVKIMEVRPEKNLYAPGEEAQTGITLRNRSNKVQNVEIAHELISGIDEVRSLGTQKTTLQPLEQKRLNAPWNAGQRLHGVTFRTRLFLNGKEIDREEEVTSINTFAPQPGQMAILNPAGAAEGSEEGAAELHRQNYITVLEYYCWMPDQLFDLTPDTEEWHPHTESQGAYEGTLTRTYLKTLSQAVDARGIGFYAMLSGFVSLPNIYRYPERMRYTAAGQPHLYNGAIHNGKRYAVGPANFFDRDFVRDWAKEMVASIEEFGWKGCRWDCNFLPNVPSDPLAMDATSDVGAANLQENRWYNFKGEASDQLFPDADQTGAMLLKEWRSVVAERYPDFVYGTNLYSTEEGARRIPNYYKEASNRSLILLEYLLNPNKEAYHTWEKWAYHLTGASQRIRANGGQPAVGYMRGFLPGGVAQALSQYLVFASGVHWAAYVTSSKYSLDDSWKRFRHAMRFSEYFYDPALIALNEGQQQEVTIDGSERILPFRYQRKSKQGRDIVVHLLNRPRQDWIVVHHERPEVRENVRVSIALKEGEKVKRAAVLLPDPYPVGQPLEVTLNGDRAEVVIPRLELLASLVVEMVR